MADNWVVERLAKRLERSAFQCGHPTLDDWLVRRAGQFDRRDLADVCRGATRRPGRAGYYALSNHHVQYARCPKTRRGLPRIELPVVLLGRLAVARSAQGHGLGSFLLIDALCRCEFIAEQIGVRAVEVHALDDAARRFWLKFGFIPLLDDPHHLFRVPADARDPQTRPPAARLRDVSGDRRVGDQRGHLKSTLIGY